MSDTIRKTREENKEIGSYIEKRIVLHTFTLVAAIYVCMVTDCKLLVYRCY